MTTLLSLGGSLGVAAAAFLLLILGLLSNRLGVVLKTPPHYRWFYAGVALVGLAWLVYLVHLSLAVDPVTAPLLESAQAQTLVLLLYHLPLAAGLTIGLVEAWRYWSWLLWQG